MADQLSTMGPIHGSKLYQERARRALPILVRQAEARQPIYYSDLAEELGMSNPSNLNYVLGCIGETLHEEAARTGRKIPPIQCMVLNRASGLPGEGIAWFLDKDSYSNIDPEAFKALPPQRRRAIVQAELQQVYLFGDWREVLASIGLQPLTQDFSDVLRMALARGGGESPDHLALKTHVATNPGVVGLPSGTAHGETERGLPSGDSLDVSFELADRWIAAEVKSRRSGNDDLARGLFQCVKYKSVMRAVELVEGTGRDVDVFLVVEGDFPPRLVPLRNMLGVSVIETAIPSA